MMTSDQSRLRVGLLGLRVSIFIVMAVRAVDKLLAPAHAAAVFGAFYGLEGVTDELLMATGLVQLTLEVAFVLGVWRFWTYGYVLIAHGLSTAASWR